MMKIGAVTIGQAPRTDVTSDIMHIFDGRVELYHESLQSYSVNLRSPVP